MGNPYSDGLAGSPDRRTSEQERSETAIPGRRAGYFDNWAPPSRPVVPASVLGVLGLMVFSTGFWAFSAWGSSDGPGSGWPFFWIALFFTVVLGGMLCGNASRTVRWATTGVAVMYGLTIFGAVVAVPLIFLLWRAEVTEYIDASENYRHARRQER